MLFSILEHIGRVSRRILVSNVSEGALSNVAEGYDGVRCRSVDVEVAVDGGGKERFHSNVNARNGRAGGGGIVRSLLLLAIGADRLERIDVETKKIVKRGTLL